MALKRKMARYGGELVIRDAEYLSAGQTEKIEAAVLRQGLSVGLAGRAEKRHVKGEIVADQLLCADEIQKCREGLG